MTTATATPRGWGKSVAEPSAPTTITTHIDRWAVSLDRLVTRHGRLLAARARPLSPPG